MRVKTYSKGGYIDGGFTSGGGTMTGPLILAADPTKDLEASTKQYADSKLLSFDASKFTSGTLQVGRLPAFTGDVTSVTGSSNISLATIGVSPGVYTKVTVTAKGLVSVGLSLTESDLPDLDWGKVTTGKPVTLAGYGITDGLPKTGGTVAGTLTLSGDPTVANQAATKQYVDSNASSFSALKTGDIVVKMNSVTPTGFLKCNGAELAKTTYAALYAAVGDGFTTKSTPAGSGKPWLLQYQINTTMAFGDNLPLTATTGLPVGISGASIVVTKNRVYLLGGLVGGAYSSAVYTAPINSDGTLGAWAADTALPGISVWGQAVVTKNRVYLMVGGGTFQATPVATVYTAPINADGTLGAWSTDASLPGNMSNSQAIVTKNRVYMLGGYLYGSTLATVYTAPINTDGTLGAWTTGTPLPIPMQDSVVAVTKNRVYLISPNSTTSVYTAPINADGTLGTWTLDVPLPSSNGIRGQAFVTKNTLYFISRISYYAQINVDGTLGGWTPLNSIGASLDSYFQCIATSSYLYTMGGASSNLVYRAPISGSVNDYSSYYNGSAGTIDPIIFALPDLTSSNLTGSYSYIKL